MKEGRHEEKVKKQDGMSTIIVNLIINNNTVAILLVMNLPGSLALEGM